MIPPPSASAKHQRIKGPPLGGSSQDWPKWLIAVVSCRPLRIVGTLPNGLFIAYKRGVIPIILGWSSKHTILEKNVVFFYFVLVQNNFPRKRHWSQTGASTLNRMIESQCISWRNQLGGWFSGRKNLRQKWIMSPRFWSNDDTKMFETTQVSGTVHTADTISKETSISQSKKASKDGLSSMPEKCQQIGCRIASL